MAVSIDARVGQREIDAEQERADIAEDTEVDGGNGDQANVDNRDDRVDSSDSVADRSYDGFDPSAATSDISYDFTPNVAVDKDEASLIAYDKYSGGLGDPTERLRSIRERMSSTSGNRTDFSDPDTDDVVGAYVRAAAIREVDAERTAVMERASKSGPALAERAGAPGAGYVESERVREQQRQGMIADDISMVGYEDAASSYDAAQARVARAQAGMDAEQSMLETEQRDVRAELEARRSLAASQLDPQVVGGRTMYSGGFFRTTKTECTGVRSGFTI